MFYDTSEELPNLDYGIDGRGGEVVWLHRWRLGRKSIRPKEYIN